MSHRRTLIKPPSRLNQPSRLNATCPVWFEQKCQPPQLPPLSPQYQTFSSPNPRIPALNVLNANNNNNHNYRHNCSHTLNTRNTHNPHNTHSSHSSHHYQHKHNNHNNNYLRNTNVGTSHQRRIRMLSQTDASSNTMPIIGSNNNNNYQHIPSQLSLASASNNNIHNTFMPNMYNASTANTMSSMSNTTNNSNNSNNGIIPTPFSNTAASNNRINNIPIPIPMIAKPNNMINVDVSSFNKHNDNLQRLLPHIDMATNAKTKTVNKMSRMDEKEQGKEKKAMQEVDELDEYKQSVKGWWIGQRIIVETQEGKKVTARIKDYFVATDMVQIWFDNDQSTFETIKLSDLLNWCVPDTYKISQYKNLTDLKYKIIDFIPNSNRFKPMDIDLLQRVQILYRDGKWYTAFIDGYDPVSRRHHVNYGDTAEWLWATKDRIKPLNMRIMDHAEKSRTEIELNGNYAVSPPWDPIPYGLDENFQIHSSKLIKEKSKKSKRKSKRSKRKKMDSSSDEDYVVDNKKNRKMRKQKRKNSDLSISTESNQPNSKRQRITMNAPSAMGSNIINNTSTTIMVNNNYNHNNAKKRKCKIKPKKIKPSIPSKPPPPKKKKKNKKYPRIATINGNIWKRTYSREEKKYFWCNNSSESSWNPWNDKKLNAPWMGETRQKWAKFKDEDSRPYYFNYKDSKSTYKKPLDYKSDDQIDHDSAEDDDEYDD